MNEEDTTPIYYKDQDEYMQPILKEMCKRVKAPYTKINYKEPDWFMMYSWTEQEEKDFEKWLSNYLYIGGAELRRKITGHNIKSKKYTNKSASMFCFNFGWTLKPTDRIGIR